MGSKLYYILAVCFLSLACQRSEPKLFQLVAKQESQITFENALTPTTQHNILDYLYFYNGGGVAIGDINNDGLPDIYFTGNQVKNKLYLNKGNFQFEDITEKAKVAGNADWNTGVTMADVNGDGLLDIYVCAVSGIHNLKGHNELFINNGDLTFTEQAKPMGLGYDNYSSTAAFFDYDNDGDLDMYLLNQAVHTEESYGASSIRSKRMSKTGDKLLRNDNGVFVDVSETAGIFGGENGYGLGVSTADFDNDGDVDIYVSNDFHEDDYYYLNQGDDTFKESVKEKFGHIGRFSMGSDVADINNDGYYDLITLDMMPESEKILKASAGEDNIDIHNLKVDKLGYHYQYARNMLQINQKAAFFSETALLSGVSATDWSWSALFADFDLDGNQDLFISNGIPKRPNNLDYVNYISNQEIRNQLNNTNSIDQKVLAKMPSGASQNYLYQGTGTLKFNNRSSSWLPENISFSNGSAYADLDNDGDLDLVTNNIDAPPFLYKNNKTNTNHYLKLRLKSGTKNTFGLGSKALLYQKGKLQYKQLFTSKGFQSSSEPVLHFGFKSETKIDSLIIVWPDRTKQALRNIKPDTTLTIRKEKQGAQPFSKSLFPQTERTVFSKIEENFGINHAHIENDFIDFKKQGLIPYKISDRTRAMVVGDINNDQKDDIFIGGSKTKPAAIYIQQDDGFVLQRDSIIELDFFSEDIYVLLEDFDNVNGDDLLVVSGGGEFSKKDKPLLDRYYRNNGKGSFYKEKSFPKYFENSSVVKTADIDNDGDLDLFVGSQATANDFGRIPNSYLLENTEKGFKIIENETLQKVGMVTDAVFSDYDKDGDQDLIVVGEWMQPTFFQNNQGIFNKASVIEEKLNGLWQVIVPIDIDNDGDLDYALGNWGLNSKYKASSDWPMLMYYGDIDKNGMSETVLCIEKEENYFALNSLDELVGQLPSLKKKFNSYSAFAGSTIEEIFEPQVLDDLSTLEVHELASGYLRNHKESYVFVPFEEQLQVAPITNMLTHDFSNNDQPDIFMAGNYMGVTPYHGRLDAFMGAILFDNGAVAFGKDIGINLGKKQVSQMRILTIKNHDYMIVMINNNDVELYKIQKKSIKNETS